MEFSFRVYLPIAIDVVLSNTNYIYDKKEIIYLFRETNLILYCSGLHSICIGDSFVRLYYYLVFIFF